MKDVGRSEPFAGWAPCAWDGFGRREEAEFQAWYHEEYICKDLSKRLFKQTVCVLALTLAELACLTCYVKALGSPLPVAEVVDFMAFRAVALLLGLLCTAAAQFGRGVLRWRRLVQGLLVASTCATISLLFFSYSVLPFRDASETKLCSMTSAGYSVCGVTENLVLLAAFPAFVMLTSHFPIRFSASFIFPLLVVVGLKVEQLQYDENKLFQSFFFKFFFFTRPIWYPLEAYLRERSLRERYKTTTLVNSTMQRINGILDTLLPPMVADDLRSQPLIASPQHEYLKATVAQSDLCGFTRLASTRHPEDVVEILGELFGRFDALTDRFGIYKVETVGDAYIAGQAEQPLTERNSPVAVVSFAMAMVKATHDWSRSRGEAVSCRVGVHFGKCVGGIVGKGMQRYHLFGELLTLLELLESTAPQGGVQVSEACHGAFAADVAAGSATSIVLVVRGGHELVSSKGEAYSYSEVGGRPYLAFEGASIPSSDALSP